jgi:sterol desaturase/sphingolipid hydroxylase (fatty acid hydroxylase superfamily)
MIYLNMISQNTIDYVFIPFLVHLLSYWSFSSIFFIIDCFCLPEKHINWSRYKLAAITSFKNQLYVSLPTLYSVSDRMQTVIEDSVNDSILFSMWKIFLIINISNLFFYWFHRLLHVPFMFRYVHSKHHEFIEPIGVAALYAHPIEHFLANTFSFICPFLYIGCNYYIMLGLLFGGSIIPVFYHTKSFRFFNDHLVHHQLFKYNFGFGGYLDKIFGTYNGGLANSAKYNLA